MTVGTEAPCCDFTVAAPGQLPGPSPSLPLGVSGKGAQASALWEVPRETAVYNQVPRAERRFWDGGHTWATFPMLSNNNNVDLPSGDRLVWQAGRKTLFRNSVVVLLLSREGAACISHVGGSLPWAATCIAPHG